MNGRARTRAAAVTIAVAAATAGAQQQPGGTRHDEAAARAGPPMAGVAPPLVVPRVLGRLRAGQIGLIVNTADPYSVAVGEYYAQRRGLAPEQLLRVELPVTASLNEDEFEQLRQRIAQKFGAGIQALALAWNQPYAVGCNAITGALALGLDLALCQRSCDRSRASPYFNSASTRPFTELGLRPAMLIAAGTVAEARALIDRGVAADGAALRRGAPPPRALYLPTDDAARNVRARWYPPAGLRSGVEIARAPVAELPGQGRLILLQTGLAAVPGLDSLHWLPGALADHLTSFGGVLAGHGGQTTALQWIQSGATASYGTVSEPCNHPQKFPHPQALLLHYLQGETAIEAYWKSVAWPQQGLFIGEPLAAPFARRTP